MPKPKEEVIEPVEEVIKPVEEVIEEEPVEESPFKAEAERIEAAAKAEKERLETELDEEKAERKRLLQVKDQALAKEKEKTKLTKDEWIEEATAKMREERKAEKHEDAINALTTDPAARKVITWHLNNSVLKGSDVDENVLKAWAIANAARLEDLQNTEREENLADERSMASMGGSSARGSMPSHRVTPATKMADRMAAMVAGKDKDRLKNLQRYNRENL